MTREELQVAAREKCDELVSLGWDYDEARFATMALAKSVLGNDNPATEDWQKELQQEFAKLEAREQGKEDCRSPHLPDFDFDTSANGVE